MSMDLREHPAASHPGEDHSAVRSALADHRFAVEQWLKSSPAERPHHWRAVEAAWRRCKQLGADVEASK